MDFCLRFKKRDHLQAFESDFTTRVKRTLVLGVLINGGYAICVLAQRLVDNDARNSVSTIFAFSKTAAAILWILGVFLIRMRLEKFKKYHKLIFILFDIFQCLAIINLYPNLSQGQLKRYGGIGLLITGWCSGIRYICGLKLIETWQIKVLHIVGETIYFAIYLEKIEDHPISQIISLLLTFVMYVLILYFAEKFTRKEFLEKRKMYEDSEAVKSILDDITEGIVIINQQKKIVYLNQPVQKMFHLEQHKTTDDLFSRIKTKSMLSAGISNSPSLIDKQSQQGRCLVDIFDDISEDLLKSSVDEEDHWILVEASAEARSSDSNITTEPREICTQLRNYVIKFTTSFYHENKVIVANISDTTDRDKLLSLQDNSKYKTRLLASVSHELRTPLNASINFTEQALLNSEVPETIKEKYILPAFRSNKLLLCLINDILDFSQIEANKLRLVFEPKSVIQTAKECIELLEIQASKKGLELKLESSLESTKEEMLNTDHNRLKQVILNLLSNAVKFTFEGRVLLKIEEFKKTNLITQSRGIKVSCIDTGIGISEENQEKLFQAFEKFELGDKVALNSTGVGLGLVISNSIVQHLNGKNTTQRSSSSSGETRAISFKSQKDKGSMFSFVVVEQTDFQDPILSNKSSEGCKMFEDTDTEEQMSKTDSCGPLLLASRYISALKHSRFDSLFAKSIPNQQQQQCQCPKVLIVDDDAFNLTALELHLLKLGIPCDSAFNGLIALNKIFERQKQRCCQQCQQYSVIFLDCNMPVLDGLETAKRLRDEIENQMIDPLNIICCTAFVQQSELDRALQAGMDSYCTKPVSLEVVRQKLLEFAPNLLAEK